MAEARGTSAVFALAAAYAIGMGLLTPAVSALVSRRGGAHAGAALGLESSAKSLGQIAGPVLGGVLFGASLAIPFWLASGLLLGLAPIFAWSDRRRRSPCASTARSESSSAARVFRSNDDATDPGTHRDLTGDVP